MAKTTPMERVLVHYPNARCHGYACKRFISFHVKSGDLVLGIGDSVRGAWRDAAARINRAASTRKA